MNENVLLAEEFATKAARDTFQQLQVIRFLNKKVGAIGDALTSTRSFIAQIEDNDEVMALFETVNTRQADSDDVINQMLEVFDGMKLTHEVEAITLTDISTKYARNIEIKNSEISSIKDAAQASKEKYDDDLQAVREKLAVLTGNLTELVSQKDLVVEYQAIVADVETRVAENKKEAIKHRVAMAKQVTSIGNLVRNNVKLISLYKSVLVQLTENVADMDKIITLVQASLNTTTPKALDMTSDEIINMFGAMNIVPEQVADEPEEVENVIEEESHLPAAYEEPVTIEDTSNKKRRWWSRSNGGL